MKVLKKLWHTGQNIQQLRQKLPVYHCAAVIVAAGSASRMLGTDKITAQLGGMPVICRTMEVFERCERIEEIILVTRAESMEALSRLCCRYTKLRMVVQGGATRTESVLAGLAQVSQTMTHVAVHDGARPLVTQDVIETVVRKAEKFGAAAPAIAVKDTIKISDGAAVCETPDRSALYAVQTPQVFDIDLLRAALQNAQEKELAVTDDCSAVELLGMTVMLTQGSEENIKITTPLDLELAEAIIRRRNAACASDTDTTYTG